MQVFNIKRDTCSRFSRLVEELPKETQIDESVKSQKSVESKLDNLGTTQQEIQIAIKKLII